MKASRVLVQEWPGAAMGRRTGTECARTGEQFPLVGTCEQSQWIKSGKVAWG